ncbi:MAG: hypothetical protein HUU32_17660 [Calditrichaceae bacterium]|nr:hypothetical protein [Calditrichia bacterium]NUQ43220.1 hypothetical protein [Calditrichaceae bacterium]
MMARTNKNRIKYFQEKLLFWFKENGRAFPWRDKKLTTYQKVVSEVFLQRTKAETVAKFYPKFIKNYPSWKSLVNAKQKDIEKYLKPLGLYKQRSHRLLELAKEMAKRNGRFPKDRQKLESIPFVGQYIANAILLLIHNEPQPLLDVNMARVLERFFEPRKLVDIRDDPFLQELSRKIVNHRESKLINWAIIDFATLICKKNPLCDKCVLRSKCNYFKETFAKDG